MLQGERTEVEEVLDLTSRSQSEYKIIRILDLANSDPYPVSTWT